MILARIKKYLASKLYAKEKEFYPAILEVTETPPSPVGRLVLWSLILLVVVGLLWSIIGHVDEVAVAPGKIVPVGNVKVIQAEDKGIVKTIAVKDGDRVKQGQVLLEMDQTFSEADLARLKIQQAQLQLEIESLTAEQTGAPFMPSRLNGLEKKDIEYQWSVYLNRVRDYQNRLQAAQQAVYQNQANLQKAESNLINYREMYAIELEKEQRMEQLLQANAVSLFALLGQRSTRLDLQQKIYAYQAEVSQCRAALAQSQAQLEGIISAYQSEVAQKLMEARKSLLAVNEELKKAERKQALSKVTSPIDGRVSQLTVHTVGGVVSPAQALMIIVPEDARFEAEAFIANKDIGFVHVGQQAEIKIETFNFQKFGTIKAIVTSVSPDAIEDKERGLIYKVVLALDKNSVLVNDKDVKLSAGMSVVADIKIRQKRIIEFFLDTFKKYKNEALRER